MLVPGCDSFLLAPHIFGCVYFIYNHEIHVGKLDPHALKVIFLGYSPT